MKRSGIAINKQPELVSGLSNIIESPLLMGSSYINLPKGINIFNDIIEYYQNTNGVQINIHSEIYYNISMDVEKIKNTSITLFNDKVSFDINAKNILKRYIYASIKRSRVFNGVSGDVDNIIDKYINTIIDRYNVVDFKVYTNIINDNNNTVSYMSVLNQEELTQNRHLLDLYLNNIEYERISFSIKRANNESIRYNFSLAFAYN